MGERRCSLLHRLVVLPPSSAWVCERAWVLLGLGRCPLVLELPEAEASAPLEKEVESGRWVAENGIGISKAAMGTMQLGVE